ncbi:metal-dependent hydrolase [Kribbella sindirgiensis]|uniref:Metal-dependent hydrolase n=1 Tax=Kribbella sindirgiensis TaxID=1124744 RepID=A0A4R0IU25_9ACTN|nr:metal-dependent hydrolase [Kribbella sindirgiensis]TCC34938.1 metal-dependent hydrolase [Kribbella sindirgiensis]
MQIRTYLDDTYAEQVDTRVIATGHHEGRPWVAVEHCLFHPQGGGQPADRGSLEDIEVVPVWDHRLGLVTVMSASASAGWPEFAKGQAVRARIDLDARMAHAALHTAGHLIDAAGRAQGWEPAGSNHFPGQARIEFTTPQVDPRLTEPEGRQEILTELRKTVAAAIAESLPVTAAVDEQGRRAVSLGSLHSAPCGGTHVRRLGDLSDVDLSTLKVKRGRIRVSYSASHESRS